MQWVMWAPVIYLHYECSANTSAYSISPRVNYSHWRAAVMKLQANSLRIIITFTADNATQLYSFSSRSPANERVHGHSEARSGMKGKYYTFGDVFEYFWQAVPLWLTVGAWWFISLLQKCSNSDANCERNCYLPKCTFQKVWVVFRNAKHKTTKSVANRASLHSPHECRSCKYTFYELTVFEFDCQIKTHHADQARADQTVNNVKRLHQDAYGHTEALLFSLGFLCVFQRHSVE